MCGIAGINSKDSRHTHESLNVVEGMMELLESRGPDAKGRYISESQKTVLGHRRLSILGTLNLYLILVLNNLSLLSVIKKILPPLAITSCVLDKVFT